MNNHYHDIRSRIAEEPRWFDESAVPRYCEFTPRETGNIYATETALLRIACQNCGREFDVCMSFGAIDLAYHRPPLRAQIEDGSIHYGDPPNVECCPAGPTMNCLDLRVLEYWHQPKGVVHGWERVPELEIELPDATDPAHD